ncbi:SDR family NAD(P)-dependent oxidoreductase [Nocardia aurantia]|uniref:3-oxoacyl-[acyl-carrier-protein] reductase FabG n=1 Tax=Nocardia aurantia TaxID=2585199 RepID=A0A7K0DSD2_9NOCA|nr:SDR family NAD(P)-dependent oxidoreductase [Nocardia aurantia]MQY28457.1 3-oxoacyl-[acyl-carrier-protein] reductase FabG [Nocardia aurantia]
MTTSTIALVTGANKGLGRETVRRLAGSGWEVFLAARDADRGARAAAELSADGATVRFLPLDVTAPESVDAAAELVRATAGRLDVLINNAAVAGPDTHPAETQASDLRAVFETNVFGPVRVVTAFLPLLRASAHPRIVMVSSGMGSIATITDPRWKDLVRPTLGYPASKAALNMLTTVYAQALDGIRVNAVDPGFTATDLNGHTGIQTLEQGTDAIVQLATIGPEGPTGGFFDRNGIVPW